MLPSASPEAMSCPSIRNAARYVWRAMKVRTAWLKLSEVRFRGTVTAPFQQQELGARNEPRQLLREIRGSQEIVLGANAPCVGVLMRRKLGGAVEAHDGIDAARRRSRASGKIDIARLLTLLQQPDVLVDPPIRIEEDRRGAHIRGCARRRSAACGALRTRAGKTGRPSVQLA